MSIDSHTHTHMTCTIQSDIPYVNAIHGRANKNTFLTIAYKEVCAIEIDQLSAKENTLKKKETTLPCLISNIYREKWNTFKGEQTAFLEIAHLISISVDG